MVAGIDCDELGTRLTVDADFVLAASLELEIVAESREGERAEFADGVGLAGRQDKVVGLVALYDLPHAFDVIGGKTPVSRRLEVAEVELVLQPFPDARRGHGDLSRHESLAANRGLVIEED